MTISARTVVLKENARQEDAERISEAIKQLRGVLHVTLDEVDEITQHTA